MVSKSGRIANWLLVAAVSACSSARPPSSSSVLSPPFLAVATDERRGAIVPADYALKMYAPPIRPAPDGYWTPTQEDIAAVELMLRPALEKALSDRRQLRMLAGPAGNSPEWESPELRNVLDYREREIRKILDHFRQYAAQYVGTVEAGKRVIWCSYFPLSDVEGVAAFSRVVDGYVVVNDGGFWYWRIKCAPDTGECRGFNVNGYA
jgi:hypothetical protein